MGTLPRKHILIVGLAALAFVLTGAIVGLVVTSPDGSGSAPVRKLALRPIDLPPDFVLAEEKPYSCGELMAGLPADAQTAEQGLKEAIHLTYVPEDDIPIVDVFVYAYEDEDTAEAAHTFARATDLDTLRPLELGNGMRGYMSPVPFDLVLEGMGDDDALMTGSVEYDDGDENTVGDSLTVQIYFMRSGSARAEVRVAGDRVDLDPEGVARNQYLRLETPAAVVAP